MKKQLNFYPTTPTGCNYKELIMERKKWTTVRFGDKYAKDYRVGEIVAVTCGFDPATAEHMADGVITRIELKKLGNINDKDLEGESPDSLTRELLLNTLNGIYEQRLGRKVHNEDLVTIISWNYL